MESTTFENIVLTLVARQLKLVRRLYGRDAVIKVIEKARE